MKSINQVTVPGNEQALTYERDADGHLVRIAAAGRVYVETCGSERRFGEGLAVVSDLALPSAVLRRVSSGMHFWTEEYLWDERRQLISVDGVRVQRDDRGRIISCEDENSENDSVPQGIWRYAYAGDRLVVIDCPAGVRHVIYDTEGRSILRRDYSGAVNYRYDASGRRCDAKQPPASWRRDAQGRLWTVLGPDGRPTATYLWDGFHCIARIDGAVGDPLSVVYSLDPSGTPVRVISREGVVRIPRDAYGESLLQHPGVPGIYGGAHSDGWVHLPFRLLDPTVGAFDAPDSWSGGEDDPRRAAGFRGELTTERHDGGPLTVSRHDPIGRTDPTGALSWWLIPSDLTWSYLNNLNTIFTMWLVGNPFLSLFDGALGGSAEDNFDIEGVSSSSREGSFAIRSNGFFSATTRSANGGTPRAWTYQHLMWLDGQSLKDLQDARLFDPQGDFRPTYYGTMLSVIPSKGPTFSLTTSIVSSSAINWSRAGGPGQPVIPGSIIPFFPTGGFHFDSKIVGTECPQSADLKELTIGSALIPATVAASAATPGTSAQATLSTAFPAGSVAARIYQVPALPTTTLLFPSVNVNGGVGTVSLPIPAGATLPTGSLITIQATAPSSTPVAAVVSRISLGLTLDRSITPGSGPLSIVTLAQQGGFTYQASFVDGATLTVLPTATGAATPVQMPRFRPLEIVQVTSASVGTTTQDIYRIDAVQGTTITLSGGIGPIATPAAGTTITVTRMDPQDPVTGGLFAGINGAAGAPSGASTSLSFDVWGPLGLAKGNLIAVTDGTTVFPASVGSIDSLALTIVAAAATPNGTYNFFSAPSVVTWDAPAVSSTAVAVPNGKLALGNLFFALAFTDPGRVAHGALSGGGVLVPIDPDNFELNRRDALVEHELRHTLQAAAYGPLFFGYFPFWALDLGLDIFTDIEMPSYSGYAAGKIDSDASAMVLTIPDAGGIPFAAGDQVQIQINAPAAQGTPPSPTPAPPIVTTLGVNGPKGFTIPADTRLTVGMSVNVRRQGNSSTAAKVLAGIVEFGEIMTAGGLNNLILGAVFAGCKEAFGRLFYAAGRLIGSGAKTIGAGVINSGLGVQLADADYPNIKDASQLSIQSGNSTEVRNVTGRDPGDFTLTLDKATTLTGQVQVASYSTHTAGSLWDWNDYYPASVPDPSQPAMVKIDQVSGSTLSLSVFDRVIVSPASGTYNYNRVSVVNADGTVVLDNPPVTDGDPGNFRIARVGDGGPGVFAGAGGTVDDFFLSIAGLDWLRWIIDPYGRIQYAAPIDRKNWRNYLTHALRYMFSTKSWLFLFWGKFWQDRVFISHDYLSTIEQEASENSGDTYSPIGRLPDQPAFIGDIGRYWHTFTGGTRDNPFNGNNNFSGSVVPTKLQDRPGAHYSDIPRLIPHLDTSSQNLAAEPNTGARVDPSIPDPADDIPDIFYQKTAASPLVVQAAGPTGFKPSNLGYIPTSPTLERTIGMYTAFSRPQTHRVTVVDTAPAAAGTTPTANGAGLDCQNHGVQTLWFDVAVQDVTCTIAGIPVPTVPGTPITLLQTQSALIKVSPNGSRRYAVTVLNPANDIAIRNVTPEDLTIVAQSANTPAAQAVEVSRIYKVDPSTGKYSDGGVQQHGVHIPADIHVPVRQFQVAVTNVLTLLGAIGIPPAGLITTIGSGGTLFAMIPMGVSVPPSVLLDGTAATTAQATVTTVALAGQPQNVLDYIGSGFGIAQIVMGTASTLTGVSKVSVVVNTAGGAVLTGMLSFTG